eukprot:9031183-Karenia_brevis.AAC.1
MQIDWAFLIGDLWLYLGELGLLRMQICRITNSWFQAAAKLAWQLLLPLSPNLGSNEQGWSR